MKRNQNEFRMLFHNNYDNYETPWIDIDRSSVTIYVYTYIHKSFNLFHGSIFGYPSLATRLG